MVRINRIISFVLPYSLLLFGFLWIIFNGLTLTTVTIPALFVLCLFVYILIDKMKINENYKVYVGLAVWMNGLCAVYFWQKYHYTGYPVHFIDGVLITFMVYDYYKKNFVGKEAYLFSFVFLSVIGIFGMWEIYEYCADALLHIKLQGIYSAGKVLVYPIDDTMLDIAIGAMGSLLTLTIKKLFLLNARNPVKSQ